MGWILSAFSVGYALCQVPAGWIGDRFGPKKGHHRRYRVVVVLYGSLAAGFNLFATPTFWAICNDLSPHSSGSLSGLMNMGGNIGGWLSPIFTATIAVEFGWRNALYFGSFMALVAGFLWFFIDIQER